jgi:hypothetical protein
VRLATPSSSSASSYLSALSSSVIAPDTRLSIVSFIASQSMFLAARIAQSSLGLSGSGKIVAIRSSCVGEIMIRGSSTLSDGIPT